MRFLRRLFILSAAVAWLGGFPGCGRGVALNPGATGSTGGSSGLSGAGSTIGSGGFPDQDAATGETAGSVDASPEGPIVCPTMPNLGDCSPPLDIRCPYPKLSQTGCVDPINPLLMANSVIPYEVNSPLWSDGALKTRGMRIPAGKKIHVKDCVKNPTQCQVANPNNFPNFLPPYDDGKWVFPVGTVMVKNFMFPDTGTKSGMKLVETRLFVHFDDPTWVGYGYQWNDAQTEATIVPDPASDPTFVPAGADVAVQATFTTTAGLITWNYPDRAACMKCHVATTNNVPFPSVVTGGSVLGPETSQMNRMILAANGVDQINQIDKLNALNLFEVPPPMPYKAALVAPYASQAGTPPADATLEQRARSYLHANCSFCHRPDAPVFYAIDLRNDVPLKSTHLCNATPDKGDQGVLGALLLTPGDPARSVLWLRIDALPDPLNQAVRRGRMPQLASYVIDVDAVVLLRDWIQNMLPSDCGP